MLAKDGASFIKLQGKYRGIDPVQMFINPKKTVFTKPGFLSSVQKYMKHLRKTDEDNLAFLWRARNELHMHTDFNKRRLIWDELERRYEGLLRKPISK